MKVDPAMYFASSSYNCDLLFAGASTSAISDNPGEDSDSDSDVKILSVKNTGVGTSDGIKSGK